jgi:hypothetical protein
MNVEFLKDVALACTWLVVLGARWTNMKIGPGSMAPPDEFRSVFSRLFKCSPQFYREYETEIRGGKIYYR